MGTHTVGEMTYHVSDPILTHWKKHSLEVMKKTNSDRVYVVDGMERSGKSWWAFQQAGVLDKKMFSSTEEMLKRVVFSAEDFMKAIRTTKNGVIIFDEAFRGLASRSALSKINKKLVSGLMEMGQNNNIVFIVLPRIWLLDIYPAMLRSHGLFNIYIEKKSNRRVWNGYNYQDKNAIYQVGIKKGWKYHIRTKFRGNFFNKFPGGDEYMKAYLRKKAKAFVEIEEEADATRYEIFKGQRDTVVEGLMKSFFKAKTKCSKWLNEVAGVDLTPQAIGTILKNLEKARRIEEKKKIQTQTL